MTGNKAAHDSATLAKPARTPSTSIGITLTYPDPDPEKVKQFRQGLNHLISTCFPKHTELIYESPMVIQIYLSKKTAE